MQVKDIMNRNPCVIEKGKSLIEAVNVMEKCGVEGLAVIENDKVVGFVTQGDILRAVLLSYEEIAEGEGLHIEEAERMASFALNKKVEEVMSTPPLVVKDTTHLMRVLSLMAIKRVEALPVVDNEGKMIGIVTRGDLLKALRRL